MTIEQAKNCALEMYNELSGRATTPTEKIRAETLLTLIDYANGTECKPVLYAEGRYGIGAKCPVCDTRVNSQQNYCPECGVKFDWTQEWR